MRLTKILAIVAMTATSVSLSGAAQAQIREQQPAEFPASSYKGKQYVDSKGCVFIRAGIDGNVSWVPRVTRDRKTVCGFKPTGGSTAASTVAAADAPAPVQITVDAAPAPKVKPAPRRAKQVVKPKPKVVKPVVVRQTAPAPRPAPKPRVVVAPKVVQPRATQTRTVRVESPCGGASALSRQYLRGSGVRCGPQSEPVIWIKRRANTQGTTTRRVVVSGGTNAVATQAQRVIVKPKATVVVTNNVKATTRIAPRHVVKNRVNTRNVTVPRGYKRVWDDDRLNPNRAEQNLAGRADMLLVWTQTVPRRLINQSTGRDVTASVPLVYPYTNVAQQRREIGEVNIVQRDGQILKRIVRHPGAKKQVRKPVYSTRSAPKVVAPKVAKPQRAKATSKALAGKRYVQVGTFRNADNAQRTARNISRMGMPARIGKHRKGGQSYMSVQAGPFNGASAMQSAMKRLRGAGYKDAFAR